MKKLLILLFAFAMVSCTRSTEKDDNPQSDSTTTQLTEPAKTDIDYESLFKLETYLVTAKIDTSKIQSIDFDCVILVYPTEEQIEKMKKEEGEENFATIVDDSNWYLAQAIEMIDSVGVKKETASRPFLKLTGKQKNWTLDIRKENLPEWNIIFFNTNKEPVIIPSIELTTEKVRDYFEIRK